MRSQGQGQSELQELQGEIQRGQNRNLKKGVKKMVDSLFKSKSKIKDSVRKAFDNYYKTHDLFQLARALVDIADYSVRYEWQAKMLYEAIREVENDWGDFTKRDFGF
jgi:hypothetical protein